MVRSVLFDVDFTLSRPGPELGPEGYQRRGQAFGLELDPDLYDEARLAAFDDLQHHPELEHDEEIWIRFTEDIVRGMGGRGSAVRRFALATVLEWERHENFDMYDDALPTIAVLREHGLTIGLVSNGQRDLEAFVVHHALPVEVAVGSRTHGWTKPHPSIFEVALARLGVAPVEAVMVGDSFADDIAGARALGMRGILLDRDGQHPGEPDRIASLAELPGLIGLPGLSSRDFD